MAYIVIVAVLLLSSYQYDYLKKEGWKNVIYWIIIIILILLAGFRYRLGIDSIRYEEYQLLQPNLYQLSLDDLTSSRFGYGWTLFASFAKTISEDFTALQLIQSIYVNILIGRFIKNSSKHVFLGLLIYFIFLYSEFMFEVLREACAVATYTIAWKYIIEKKWIKYCIVCFFAISFHISAIVTLLVPISFIPGITTWFKVDKRLTITLLIVLLTGLYLSVVLFNYIAEISLIDAIQERAATYSNHDNYIGARQASILGLLCIVINRVLYPVVAFWTLEKNKSQINHQLEVLIVYYLYFSVISIPIMLFHRFTNYFSPFVIILISNWVYSSICLKNKKFKCKFSIWLLVLFPFFFIQLYGYFKEDGGSGVMRYRRYYPYSSVLTKERDREREQIQNHYSY